MEDHKFRKYRPTNLVTTRHFRVDQKNCQVPQKRDVNYTWKPPNMG